MHFRGRLKTETSMNKTKTLIRSLKKEAPPVLTTIVNYGGHESVSDIIALGDYEDERNSSPFAKILKESIETETNNSKSAHPSFMDYKACCTRKKLSQLTSLKHKSRSKNLKTSIIVEMPSQLKALKSQILALPSIGKISCTQKPEAQKFTLQNSSSNLGSSQVNMLPNQSKIKAKKKQRYEQFYGKNKFLISLKDIVSESKECMDKNHNIGLVGQLQRCVQKKSQIGQQLKKFQKYGSPPKKIVELMKGIEKFQGSMENSMDQELMKDIQNMDSRKYDWKIRFEKQQKKVQHIRFLEKQRQQRMEEQHFSEQEGYQNVRQRFKLNSKGKQIFNYKKK